MLYVIFSAHVRRAEAGNAEALKLEWGTAGSQAITEGLRECRLDFVVAADCCYDDQAPISLQWCTRSMSCTHTVRVAALRNFSFSMHCHWILMFIILNGHT